MDTLGNFMTEYSFDSTTGLGAIINPFPKDHPNYVNFEHPILVDQFTQPPYYKDDPSFLNKCITLAHKHYLSAQMVDPNTGRIIRTRPSDSFDEFVGGRLAVVTLHGGSGVGSPISRPYLDDFASTIIRSITVFIRFIHSEHLTVVEFSRTNLVFIRKVLKFTGVRFIPLADKGVGHAYRLLHDFLTKDFLLPFVKRPVDFNMFLGSLLCARIDEDLLVEHVSIMDSQKKLSFFRYAWEGRNSLGNARPDYTDAINDFGSRPSWLGRKFNSEYGASYQFTAIVDMVSNPAHKHYSVIPGLEGSKSLLRCCRNTGAHVSDFKHFENRISINMQADVWMTTAFGVEIVQFQKCLAARGLLYRFVPMDTD